MILAKLSKHDKDMLFKGVAVGSITTIIIALLAVSVSQAIHMFSLVDVGHLNLLTDIIEKEYYKDVDKEEILNGVYNGLFASLDEYSCYYTPDEYEKMQSQGKKYSGVGVTYAMDAYTGSFVVIDLIEGSPAYEAGVHIDDVIFGVDGHSLKDKKLDEVKMILAGDKGTEVEMKVLRGRKELTFTMVRDDVINRNCRYYELSNDTGYIVITSFGGEVVEAFTEGVKALKSKQNIIIDLRNNPGGEVDLLMQMLSKICPDGLVTTLKYKNGDKHEYKLTGGTDIGDKRYVLLVNESSASCSEIMASFMQEQGYAVVIGKETYGKGVVQWIQELASGGALKLTVASYRTSKGVDLSEKGVFPDIETSTDYKPVFSVEEALSDKDIQKAIEYFDSKKWKGK